MLMTNITAANSAAMQFAGGYVPGCAKTTLRSTLSPDFTGYGEGGYIWINGGEAARFSETFKAISRKEPPTEYLTASEPVDTGKGSLTA